MAFSVLIKTNFGKETIHVEMAWSQPKMNFEVDFFEMWGLGKQ